MSRIVRAITGVVLVAAAIIAAPYTGGTSLAFLPSALASVGASLTIGAAAEALAKKPRGPAPQGVQGNATGSQNAHSIVFGKVKCGGVLHSLKTAGASNQYAYFSLALSITHRGGADRIGRIWIESDEITESQITASTETDFAGQAIRRYNVTGGKYAGLVDVWFRRGTATQGTPNTPQVGILGVTEYARGVATVLVRLRRDLMDEAGFQRAFNGRFPSPVTFELYGNRVYDPRLDSTAGGSGPQRVADPTTWTWSDNPALCAATHSIMSYADGGEGLAAADINWFSVAAAANVCDQSDGAGGRIYRCSALLTTAADRRANTALLLDAMAGVRAEIGTFYTFFAGTWRTPNFAIDHTWLRNRPVITPRVPLSELFNAVRATARDERGDYSSREIPPYINPAFEAQDGNRRLYRDLDYPTVANLDQAQRMAAVVGRKSRRQMSMMLQLNLRGMVLETWETGTVTLPGIDLSGRTFRIKSFMPTEEGPEITLEEDYAEDYGAITPQAVPVYSPPDVVYAQPPALTNFAGVAIADGAALSWDVTPAYQDFPVVVFRRAEGSGMAFDEYAVTYGTSWRDTNTNGAAWEYYVVTRLPNGQQSNVPASTVIVRGKTVADGADVTAEIAPPMVSNPGFEAGDAEWSKNGTGWSIVKDAANARTGEWYARRDADGTASDGNLISAQRRPVAPGGNYAFGGVIASSATVTGFAFIGLLWQDADGIQIPVYPQTNIFSTAVPNWGVARGFAQAPANARFVQIDCAVQGAFTAGHWRFDDLSIVEWPDSVDHVPDGPIYARTGGTYLQAGRPRSVTSGKNMLVNPTFELATVGIGASGGGSRTMQAGVVLCDGWETSTGDGTNLGAFPQDAVEAVYDTVPSGGTRNAELLVAPGRAITVNGNSYHSLALQSDRIYPRPNEPFLLNGQRWVDSAYLTSVAGLEFIARIGICWFTSTGALLSSGGFQFADLSAGTGSAYAAFSLSGTVPAAAAFGRVYIGLFVRNTTGATITPGNFYAVFRVDDLSFTQPVSLDAEVLDGGTFGKTRVDILTDNRPDFAKPIPNRTADYIAETGGRRWAAETGATVGATAGVNLRRNSGTTLNDADVITSMGTANDVSNVGGINAFTVRDGGLSGAGLVSNSSGVRLGGPRNLGAVRFAGPGAIFDSSVVTASYNNANPATVTFTFTATTLRAGGFPISYATATASTTQGRSSSNIYYLYFDSASVLSGGSFTLLFSTKKSDLANGPDRIHVGTITVNIPSTGANNVNGTTSGGGVIP